MLIGLLACLTSNSFGQTYSLGKNSNVINWKGYGEVGGFTQEGTISIKSSTLTVDKNGLYSGEVIIDMKSISNKDKTLVKHLKNTDFFDVKKFPTAKMSFSQTEGGSVSGELNIKGVSGNLSFIPSIKKVGDQIMVTGKATIDRTYYGIKYNSSSYFQDLGSYAIKNDFDIAFQLVYTLDP